MSDHSDKNIICEKCKIHCCKKCILLNPFGRQNCLYCLKRYFNQYNWVKIKENGCGEKY